MGGFKSGTGDFDAEAAVSSVGFEIRWEGVQLHSWEIWFLNNGTGRNKVVIERLQQVPQKTAAPMDLVQRKIINEHLSKVYQQWQRESSMSSF